MSCLVALVQETRVHNIRSTHLYMEARLRLVLVQGSLWILMTQTQAHYRYMCCLVALVQETRVHNIRSTHLYMEARLRLVHVQGGLWILMTQTQTYYSICVVYLY